MRPSDLRDLIKSRFNALIARPLHVESSPGLGKTQIAKQVSNELEVSFRAIHAPLLQPEDYGFPVIASNRDDVRFIVSKEKFPVERSNAPDRGIFLIDELSQADASAQKILANLIQEREIHGERLKPGWMIVTTGNRASDRAGANRLLTHLKNRLTCVTLEASIDDWADWAHANSIRSEVVSFIRFRPELLNSFDPNREVNATPRAWAEGVSPSLGVVSPHLEAQVFAGDVGEGPAAEFVAYLQIYRNLPDIDQIFSKPLEVDVPSDPATQYALTGALASRATLENFGAILKYIARLPKEFTVLLVKEAIRRDRGLQKSKDFLDWAVREGTKLLSL